MFNLATARARQGYQVIRDIRKASVNGAFRGLPVISPIDCGDCSLCLDSCPTRAISADPLRIDMGRCIFCGDCARECPKQKIHFTPFSHIAAGERDGLLVDETLDRVEFEARAVRVNALFHKYFGRALSLRSVSAGGCNGCELELGACSNVNFDMGRFGITIAASPRHADGIVLTGPITRAMGKALDDAWNSVPEPKMLILAGACAISGGLFADSPEIDREFLEKHHVDLYVPGCPFHPLSLINGILALLGAR